MFGWCAERNIRVSMVYAPSALQYDADYQKHMSLTGGDTRAAWLSQETELEKRLTRFAMENNKPFLNLTPNFRQAFAETSTVLNYPLDGHWTAEGNQLVASHVLRWIKDEKLV